MQAWDTILLEIPAGSAADPLQTEGVQMTETRLVESSDHMRIAYDVAGRGQAIVLLHGGFIQDRRSWHEAGYVERLSKEYTVVSVDLRGHGESDRPLSSEAYAPDRLIDDIKAVVNAYDIKRFFLWGYSLGGTVGLQVASNMKDTLGVVLVGVWFGKLFTPETTAEVLARIEAVERALDEGVFDQLEMAPGEKDFFSKVDTSLMKNFGSALAEYRPVEPAQLLCPALMVAGTANQPAAAKLKGRESDISVSGSRTLFLKGLDHAQEFSEIDQILPECLNFLRSLRS
jgi:pimeloyl-ACP methyl ester carboxylesterase